MQFHEIWLKCHKLFCTVIVLSMQQKFFSISCSGLGLSGTLDVTLCQSFTRLCKKHWNVILHSSLYWDIRGNKQKPMGGWEQGSFPFLFPWSKNKQSDVATFRTLLGLQTLLHFIAHDTCRSKAYEHMALCDKLILAQS